MEMLPTSPDQAAQFVWVVSLVLGLVVALVVTLLLWLIYNTAGKIDGLVSKIWDKGQQVANNTIHIPALARTNAVVGQILETALRINSGAEAIAVHAKGCPGCPHCMLEH